MAMELQRFQGCTNFAQGDHLLPSSTFPTSSGYRRRSKETVPECQAEEALLFGFVTPEEFYALGLAPYQIKLEKHGPLLADLVHARMRAAAPPGAPFSAVRTAQRLPNGSRAVLLAFNTGMHTRVFALRYADGEALGKFCVRPQSVTVVSRLDVREAESAEVSSYHSEYDDLFPLVFQDETDAILALVEAQHVRCGYRSPARCLTVNAFQEIAGWVQQPPLVPIPPKHGRRGCRDDKEQKPVAPLVLRGDLDVEVYPAGPGQYHGTMGIGWRPPDTAVVDTSAKLLLKVRLCADYDNKP
eukprot:TRINITY_DN1791_c0_g1_i1.p1 TRINITY_DN1791_c0_g1~~TRINITY_DN1791_c0_g1_i1.p1  ORF type:complete len:307 (-),score=81.42 TRINITY_DN1791_c0_g1_i1:124-1020(-)